MHSVRRFNPAGLVTPRRAQGRPKGTSATTRCAHRRRDRQRAAWWPTWLTGQVVGNSTPPEAATFARLCDTFRHHHGDRIDLTRRASRHSGSSLATRGVTRPRAPTHKEAITWHRQLTPGLRAPVRQVRSIGDTLIGAFASSPPGVQAPTAGLRLRRADGERNDGKPAFRRGDVVHRHARHHCRTGSAERVRGHQARRRVRYSVHAGGR